MKLHLERLAKNGVFMRHLRLDVTPEVLFRPRFVTGADKRRLVEETQGFMFYIDYEEGNPEQPSLMVMKTYNLTSRTVGEVQDVPREMLLAAVKREGVRDYCGMYPIDQPTEDWITERLGLSSPPASPQKKLHPRAG
ncbi:MAG: hypothetical protein P8Y66_07160 [Nitrospirota bacterium]|jgi:hypothetical protein